MSMDEKDVNAGMVVVCAVIAVVAGVAALLFFIAAAVDTNVWSLLAAIFLSGLMSGTAWATVQIGQRLNPDFVHSGSKEHVLTLRQKRLLRRKRGEVVLEQALIEVEQERDNITHRAIEAANDPNKPPHETQWSRKDEWEPPPGNEIQRRY